MTVKLIVPLAQATVQVEADSVKDAIKKLSGYYDVFGEKKCGECGHEELAVQHRKAKGYDYYELRCPSCDARLSFGQHQEGETLFPKRDKGTAGWHRWQGQ